MEIFALFISVALFAAGIAYIILPFRQKRGKSTRSASAHIQQAGQQESVLAALRDLDFDFRIGKVSEEDYKPLRAQLMMEAAQYMEAKNQEDEKLEALIQSRRKAPKSNVKCEHCGATMKAGQHFCSKCGSAANHHSCPACGTTVQDGDLFCSSCGTKIQIPMEIAAPS